MIVLAEEPSGSLKREMQAYQCEIHGLCIRVIWKKI